MIRLNDIMAVESFNPAVVRQGSGREMGFRLGPLMDRVNRRSSNTTLLTDISASHSGTVVNARVYPGMHMKASQRYWLEAYAKPLLDNHPKKNAAIGDPQPKVLGRMRKAEYIQLVSDADLRTDWVNPQPRCKGSGFSKVQVGITAKSAIEEVLSQRLLTVSAGMDSDRLLCSACGSDWAVKNGRCNHLPGQAYQMSDGASQGVMYFITGMLFYDHLAKVNTPAQPYATVLSYQFMDSAEELFNDGDMIPSQLLKLTLIDSRDGQLDILFENSTHTDPTASWKDADWAEAFILDALANKCGLKESLLDEALPKIEAFRTSDRRPNFGQPRFLIGPNGILPICDTGTAQAALKIVRQGLVKGADQRSLESRILECADLMVPTTIGVRNMPHDPNLAKEWAEVVRMADGLDVTKTECDWADFTGDLFDLATEEGIMEIKGVEAGIIPVADAVLTGKARKQLPDKAFCGPNRSFPVHDAAHVRNALARLPQAKSFTTEQKAKILACVRSKAKALGVEVGADQLEFNKLVELLDHKAPGLETKGPDGETEAQKTHRLERQLEAAKAQIRDQEALVTKLTDEQMTLASDLKNFYAQRVVELRTELKKPDVLLLDSAEKKQGFIAQLKLRTVSSLRDSLNDLEAERTAHKPAVDPRTGTQVQDPTNTMSDADKDKDKGKTGPKGADSTVEARFADMLFGSAK